MPVVLTAYPSSAWTLTLILRGPQQIDLTAVQDNENYLISVDASVSSLWLSGSYWYSLRVSNGSDVYEVEDGTLEVIQDLSTVTGLFDGRTHAEKVLQAIEAVIEGRASKDQQRYKINNRELERTPIGDLLKLRSVYRDEVRRMQSAKKGQTLIGRNVMVRF